MAELMSCIVIAAFFIILGVIFFMGKGAFLVSGYNMMSAKEKRKYNEKLMLRQMSYLMFIIAAGVIANGTFGYLNMNGAASAVNIILILIIAIFVVIINKKSRFKKK